MKKKIFGILICGILLFGITGCGTNGTLNGKDKEPTSNFKTEHIEIDGIYVDESFDDENLAMVYLFYTVNAKDQNIELSSSSMSMKVNDTNSYSATVEKASIPYYTNYYYSDIIKKIYVGKSYQLCSTFKVAKGDLIDSKSIQLNNSKISDISDIKLTTDDIKTMENEKQIAEDLDKEAYDNYYKKEQDKMANVDGGTASKVKNDINGYYFETYVNVGTKLVRYKIEFDSPNKFKVSNNLGMSNSGTYDVRKNALILNFSNGGSNTLYYEYDNGDIQLTNVNDAFGTLIEYDPLDED